MPEPKKTWWQKYGIGQGAGPFGKERQDEPLPEWLTGTKTLGKFWEWFMGRNQQMMPTTPSAPTAPLHFPGAPGQTYTEQPATAGFDLLKATEIAPGVLQMPDGSLWSPDGYRLSPQYAQSIINQYNQQLGGGGQVPSWVTANQQAVMRTMARQYQGMERQIEEAQRGQMQTQWELDRQQRMGQKNEPQDWIKRWIIKQEINPYKSRPLAPYERPGMIKGEIADWRERGLGILRDAIDPYGESRGGELDTETEMIISDAYQSQMKNLGKQLTEAEKSSGGEMAQRREVGPGLYEIGEPSGPPKPKTPPTPPWLAAWYPQQLQTGQPISKLPIATPSMQWWQQQPESVRKGWLGFAEFSGAIPMDVMSEMQRQLTQPRQPRQRSVARQRTWV